MPHAISVRATEEPRYVIQRAKHESSCFLAGDDYLVYLDCLKEGAGRSRCAIHAYALLPDAVHLLASAESEEGLAVMMRYVGGRYLEYAKYIHQRKDPVWGKWSGSVLNGGARDLLTCYRRIESQPVAAGLAASAGEYPWSSYRWHADGSEDPVVRDHQAYFKLGANDAERRLAYRDSFHEPFVRLPAQPHIGVPRYNHPAGVSATVFWGAKA